MQVQAGGNAAISLGTAFNRVGSVSGLTGSLTMTVDYGDGIGPQPLAIGQNGTLTLNHNYAVDGAYTVTIAATVPAGAFLMKQFAVDVIDPTPAGQARSTFVRTLYQVLLGRSPEPSALAFWKQALAARVKPAAVTKAIARSAVGISSTSIGSAKHVSILKALVAAKRAAGPAL